MLIVCSLACSAVGPTCRLLLVCGSVRRGSTNAAVLRSAAAGAPAGIAATIFDGLAELPHFNPDDDVDPLDPAVVRLRSAIDTADALLISTPEYAGGLPGSFKNLLDWTVGGMEIADKPIAWINASTVTGARGAHEALRTFLGYVNADIVDTASADIPVSHSAVGADGTIGDRAIHRQVAAVVRALSRYVATKSAPHGQADSPVAPTT